MIAPARLAAYATLRALHTQPIDLPAALARQRPGLRDERDRSLAADIVIGSVRWQAALDHVIAWAGNRVLAAFDPEVLDILRLSAYQLLHLDRVPASAVVSDAVELTRQQGKASAAGAVNAILRRVSRDRFHLPMPHSDQALPYLSITCSHPRWLAARWLDRLGPDAALAWVRFNNEPAPMTLCANMLCTSRDRLAESLAAQGVVTTPTAYAPDGLVVVEGNPLRTTLAPSGTFLIQSEASQLVAAFAGIRPGETVLDACAAPGGKTVQMAAALRGSGTLVACDLRPRRVRLLTDMLRKSGADMVAVARVDVLARLPFRPVFDCVLLDAPCSGLGTLRRDPDLRWTRTEDDLIEFAARQRQMLNRAAETVRPGGRMVYATCSSEPDENERVVKAFLVEHSDFTAEDPRDVPSLRLPLGVMACLDESGCLHPAPHIQPLEPFFAARLRKSEQV